jgi:hypothetical protein
MIVYNYTITPELGSEHWALEFLLSDQYYTTGTGPLEILSEAHLYTLYKNFIMETYFISPVNYVFTL